MEDDAEMAAIVKKALETRGVLAQLRVNGSFVRWLFCITSLSPHDRPRVGGAGPIEFRLLVSLSANDYSDHRHEEVGYVSVRTRLGQCLPGHNVPVRQSPLQSVHPFPSEGPSPPVCSKKSATHTTTAHGACPSGDSTSVGFLLRG